MLEEKRTKIICTIGPASSSVSMLVRMMNAGMNVCRLNFSHGTHSEHKQLMKHIRSAAKKSKKTVAILQDLQGPKMRVGDLPEEGVDLRKGQKIQFSTAVDEYESNKPMPVTYKTLHKDVKKDHRILMDDGRLEAKVTQVRGRIITAQVTVGGILKSHKGMNLPDSKISTSSFTDKDHEDLLFGLENEVDWVALSFVTSEEVINKVRRTISAKCRQLGTVPPKIIVKIERKEGVTDFPDILNAADGIMLARGDLGVELPPEEVPIIQKEFVEICRQTGKPIIVATHMLESMTDNPRATRAETSDVANAVIDHADGVMLSGESATGKHPDVAVKAMNAVIRAAEASRLDDISFYQVYDMPDAASTIAQTLHVLAENNHIDYIVTSSTYGQIADTVNIFRPNATIIMACPNESLARQMMLRAGIYSVVMDDAPGTFVHRMEAKLRRMKWLKSKHRVAYVTAAPDGSLQLTVKG